MLVQFVSVQPVPVVKEWAGTATTKKALGKDTAIGSLSLGAQRKFSFRHKKKDGHPVSIQLENGSLLVMRGTTQTFWQHSVPKTTKLAAPRINLTFRTIVLEELSR